MSIDWKAGREQVNVNSWVGESSKCKGPEASACLPWSRSSREASVARVGEEEGRVVGLG